MKEEAQQAIKEREREREREREGARKVISIKQVNGDGMALLTHGREDVRPGLSSSRGWERELSAMMHCGTGEGDHGRGRI